MKKNFTCLSLFSGLGGGALGFQEAGFELVGGLDFNEEAIKDYRFLTGSDGHVANLEELEPHELRAIVGARRPDVVFTSPPCKGFSGCLPVSKSRTKKYVQLNTLAERGIWLALETWDEPPPIILLENVPRIQSRGREWLDAVSDLLRVYGYAVTESTHDCGELGALAQRRRRFLLIARHIEQVPEFVYEPPRHQVRGCGEVLDLLPVPLPVEHGEEAPGGEMHRLGKLSPLNWLRLALIPAGGDWRDLPEEVGVRARAARHNGGWGVEDWCEAAHSIVAHAQPANTRSSVADPRLGCEPRSTVYGVKSWCEESGTVIGSARVDNGCWSLADPRVDPMYHGCYGVLDPANPAKCVRGAHEVRLAPSSVVDPRVTCKRREGAEGIKGWGMVSTTVIANGRHFNGPWQVADPREEGVEIATHEIVRGEDMLFLEGEELDLETRRATHLIIQSLDGCWHRPMTTLELAALQGLPLIHDGEWLTLEGGSKKRWRERIGNAVPPPTAEAIARTIWRSLEASQRGILLMGGEPVWVQPGEKEEAVEVSP